MKWVNLTPHAIDLVDDNGNVVRSFPPSGDVARVSSQADVNDSIDGIDIATSTYGDVTGVPRPSSDYAYNVVYIVSSLIAQRLKRSDVVAPDTGPTALRNDKGHIVGVRRFQRFAN